MVRSPAAALAQIDGKRESAPNRTSRPPTGASTAKSVPKLNLGSIPAPDTLKKMRSRQSSFFSRGDEVEARMNKFQELFNSKFQTKFGKLQDRFRFVDEDKRGALGRGELKRVFEKMAAPVDDVVIEKLLSRCKDPDQGVTLRECGALLGNEHESKSFFEDRDGGGNFGDNAKQRFLWVPYKASQLGSLNDTLEAEQLATGTKPPRLDLNFSGVRYDILTLGHGHDNVPATVRCPVKKRLALFDPPLPSGRKVSYDIGSPPYHIITHQTHYPSGSVTARESTWRSQGQDMTRSEMPAPVRLSGFSRYFSKEGPVLAASQLTFTCI